MQEERTVDNHRKPSAKPTRQPEREREIDSGQDQPQVLPLVSTGDGCPTPSIGGYAQDRPPEAADVAPTRRQDIVAAIKRRVKDGTYRIDEIALVDRLIEMPTLWEPRKSRKRAGTANDDA